ncbi:hypothetical protein DRN86_03225, partial [Candidatus Geothermarchaeota archaeon]
GNEATKSYQFIIDTTPPEILVAVNGTFLEEINYFNYTTLNISVILNENASLSIYINDKLISNETHITIRLTEGNYTLRIQAVDNSGNEAEETYQIIIDLTPPQIDVQYKLQDNVLILNVSSNEFVTIEVSVNGSLAYCGENTPNIRIELAEGLNIIKIVAKDLAGNTFTKTLKITVKPEEKNTGEQNQETEKPPEETEEEFKPNRPTQEETKLDEYIYVSIIAVSCVGLAIVAYKYRRRRLMAIFLIIFLLLLTVNEVHAISFESGSLPKVVWDQLRKTGKGMLARRIGLSYPFEPVYLLFTNAFIKPLNKTSDYPINEFSDVVYPDIKWKLNNFIRRLHKVGATSTLVFVYIDIDVLNSTRTKVELLDMIQRFAEVTYDSIIVLAHSYATPSNIFYVVKTLMDEGIPLTLLIITHGFEVNNSVGILLWGKYGSSIATDEYLRRLTNKFGINERIPAILPFCYSRRLKTFNVIYGYSGEIEFSSAWLTNLTKFLFSGTWILWHIKESRLTIVNNTLVYLTTEREEWIDEETLSYGYDFKMYIQYPEDLSMAIRLPRRVVRRSYYKIKIGDSPFVHEQKPYVYTLWLGKSLSEFSKIEAELGKHLYELKLLNPSEAIRELYTKSNLNITQIDELINRIEESRKHLDSALGKLRALIKTAPRSEKQRVYYLYSKLLPRLLKLKFQILRLQFLMKLMDYKETLQKLVIMNDTAKYLMSIANRLAFGNYSNVTEIERDARELRNAIRLVFTLMILKIRAKLLPLAIRSLILRTINSIEFMSINEVFRLIISSVFLKIAVRLLNKLEEMTYEIPVEDLELVNRLATGNFTYNITIEETSYAKTVAVQLINKLIRIQSLLSLTRYFANRFPALRERLESIEEFVSNLLKYKNIAFRAVIVYPRIKVLVRIAEELRMLYNEWNKAKITFWNSINNVTAYVEEHEAEILNGTLPSQLEDLVYHVENATFTLMETLNKVIKTKRLLAYQMDCELRRSIEEFMSKYLNTTMMEQECFNAVNCLTDIHALASAAVVSVKLRLLYEEYTGLLDNISIALDYRPLNVSVIQSLVNATSRALNTIIRLMNMWNNLYYRSWSNETIKEVAIELLEKSRYVINMKDEISATNLALILLRDMIGFYRKVVEIFSNDNTTIPDALEDLEELIPIPDALNQIYGDLKTILRLRRKLHDVYTMIKALNCSLKEKMVSASEWIISEAKRMYEYLETAYNDLTRLNKLAKYGHKLCNAVETGMDTVEEFDSDYGINNTKVENPREAKAELEEMISTLERTISEGEYALQQIKTLNTTVMLFQETRNTMLSKVSKLEKNLEFIKAIKIKIDAVYQNVLEILKLKTEMNTEEASEAEAKVRHEFATIDEVLDEIYKGYQEAKQYIYNSIDSSIPWPFNELAKSLITPYLEGVGILIDFARQNNFIKQLLGFVYWLIRLGKALVEIIVYGLAWLLLQAVKWLLEFFGDAIAFVASCLGLDGELFKRLWHGIVPTEWINDALMFIEEKLAEAVREFVVALLNMLMQFGPFGYMLTIPLIAILKFVSVFREDNNSNSRNTNAEGESSNENSNVRKFRIASNDQENNQDDEHAEESVETENVESLMDKILTTITEALGYAVAPITNLVNAIFDQLFEILWEAYWRIGYLLGDNQLTHLMARLIAKLLKLTSTFNPERLLSVYALTMAIL